MEAKDMKQAPSGGHESNSLMAAQEADPNAPPPEMPAEAEGPDDTLKSITIDLTTNGGYVVTCHHEGVQGQKGDLGGGYKSDKYAMSSREELDALLDEKLGAAEPQEPAEPAAPAGPGGMA